MSENQHPDPVRVAVLGPVAVGSPGALVEPAGHRAKALLAALALAAPQPIGADRLVDEVWGDDAPRGARAALQTQVSRIRSAFGEQLIESTPSGYRLAAAVEVDVLLAQRMLDDARAHLATHEWPAAVGACRAGLALWRGEPGTDLEGAGQTSASGSDSVAEALAARGGQLRDGLESVLSTALLEAGDPAAAEPLARRLTERAPFDDSAHLLLMRALDAMGRPTEAVAVYARFRRQVQDAFGTSPGLELQQLNLELLERDLTDARSDGTPTTVTASPQRLPGAARPPAGAVAQASDARSGATAHTAAISPDEHSAADSSRGASGSGSATTTLPRRAAVGRGIRAAPNELIGRETAIAEIEALLASTRVTTVLGPGGLGKTRIAHELAARALERYGAVIVAELASVRSADDLVFALASALGIREVATGTRLGSTVLRADLRTRILNRLGETPTLLVMDNCEHLIEAAAEWCAELTAEVPELSVLATSRTPLAISSERVFLLAPLGATGVADSVSDLEGDAAVRLFVDRATAARPGASLPLDVVGRLCRRLDGLPLAIELAAARIRSMPLEEIERRLSNRFALLTGGDRSAPERHRTLRAVIQWSWNLLGAAEQRALARLSEFADGFSAEAAAAVVAGVAGAAGAASTARPAADADLDAVREILDALVDQSLVMLRESPSGLRYRMLETVREFGQLQLDESGTRTEVRDALFAWAEGFCASRYAFTDGPRQVATFAEIAVEEDNLIDVLRRAIDAGRPQTVVTVFSLLGYVWSLRSAHSEVIAFGPPVFGAIRRYRPDAAHVDAMASCLMLIAGTTVFSDLRFAVRPRSLLRKLTAEHPLSDPRLAMMSALVTSSDEEGVRQVVAAGIASGHRPSALLGTIVSSLMAENSGDQDAAIRFAVAGANLAVSLQDTWGEAMASQMLGALYSQNAEPVEALRWARRARIGLQALGANDDIRQLEWTIAINELDVGDVDEAIRLFDRLIESPGESDGVDIASIGLAGRAEVYRRQGLHEEARRANDRAIAAFDVPRTRASPWYRIMVSNVLAGRVLDGDGTPAELQRMARHLRSRTLANLRWQPGHVDRPVLGASLTGLAVWLESVTGEAADAAAAGDLAGIQAGGVSDADPRLRRLALDLLAFAEALRARQDPSALHLAPLFERFAERYLAADVAAARAAAAAVPNDERPGRVAELLRTPGPWSVPRMV
ncbi:BTAD domain-containing putative transcriptional regulator [Herbiconiux sp.]|uniref:AfsR/SARP family transcriptional regulator n=1 Tax=Herbiconiux sp. TaxID=1871186 RepID=UPI0025C3E485|nr:BTAD domain-containing putative transcriptional regulator [Herbiconiux sp.]